MYFLIGLFDFPKILPEAVFIELLASRRIPKAASVRTDLVAQKDLTVMPAELELHIHQ